ncbi:MAG: hypothetical protein ACRC62_39670 [Microcoleus sp.]
MNSTDFRHKEKEEGRRKREEGRRKKEEGRGKKEEGRGKREEGRRKREEGRGKKSGPVSFWVIWILRLIRWTYLKTSVSI